MILSQEWKVETGELTLTLKVRINEIGRKYEQVINWLYAEAFASSHEINVGENEIAVGMSVSNQRGEKHELAT